MTWSNGDEESSDEIIEIVDNDGKIKALTKEELEKKQRFFYMVDKLPQVGFKDFTSCFLEELKSDVPVMLILIWDVQCNVEGKDWVNEEEHCVEREKRRSGITRE